MRLQTLNNSAALEQDQRTATGQDRFSVSFDERTANRKTESSADSLEGW